MESYTQDPMCQAVEAAWKAGIVVVVAAGNDGGITPSANTATEPSPRPAMIPS
jgi:serine protease AprX